MPFDTSVHFHGIEYVHLEGFLKVARKLTLLQAAWYTLV